MSERSEIDAVTRVGVGNDLWIAARNRDRLIDEAVRNLDKMFSPFFGHMAAAPHAMGECLICNEGMRFIRAEFRRLSETK